MEVMAEGLQYSITAGSSLWVIRTATLAWQDWATTAPLFHPSKMGIDTCSWRIPDTEVEDVAVDDNVLNEA